MWKTTFHWWLWVDVACNPICCWVEPTTVVTNWHVTCIVWFYDLDLWTIDSCYNCNVSIIGICPYCYGTNLWSWTSSEACCPCAREPLASVTPIVTNPRSCLFSTPSTLTNRIGIAWAAVCDRSGCYWCRRSRSCWCWRCRMKCQSLLGQKKRLYLEKIEHEQLMDFLRGLSSF